MTYHIEGNRLCVHLDQPITLKELFDRFSLSKKQRHLCRMEGTIQCNNRIVRNDDQLLEHEVIIVLPECQPDWIKGNRMAQIIHEDPFMIVVHKPHGCIIHGEEDDQDCLNARVSAAFDHAGIHSLIRPIHRLDRDTSGLVLYCRHAFFQPWFDEQLANKNIYRHYLAICFDTGKVMDHFTCTKPIGKDRHVSNRYRISKDGKDACTHFDVISRKNGYVLIGCRLETGRTHQIRVHLSHYGLQIVNDPIYERPSNDFRYMGLWADEMVAHDPITHQPIHIKDQMEEDYLYFGKRRK